MWINTENPDISWISVKKVGGEEWVTYTKTFTAPMTARSAVFRFETDCTCAVYINGQFIISGTGRMPERVNAHEVTSKIMPGENTVKLVLGTSYFQQRGFEIMQERGFWLNSAAFELCIEYADGTHQILATDDSWTAEADEKPQKTIQTAMVTAAEYDMMWKNAAVWPEPQLHKPFIAPEVVQVAGQEYLDYANKPAPEFIYPEAVLATNMKKADGCLISDPECGEAPYIVYDFGRLTVGFTHLEYTADSDTAVCFLHDISENPEDFNQVPLHNRVEMLRVVLPVKAADTTVFNLRRRAFRYLKVTFGTGVKLCVGAVKLRPCMFPQIRTGWFHSSDEMLNAAWEMGKYTLYVNKQQEYESCPRYEMQFFSGDGAIDAWIDSYAFGDDGLMNASLSVKHEESSTGVLFTNKWSRNAIQWDYFAWRIICIHLHYKATGDLEFLKRYYEEAKIDLEWQLERLNKKNLIFQRPCFVSIFRYVLGQTEWTCSAARIGEKTSLNALLYKSLTAMAELAEVMGENNSAAQWLDIAQKVKTAINVHLWSEEKQCYIDSLDDFVAQDANVFAILFDVADGERRQKALNTMKERLWSPYGSTILDSYVPHTRGGNTTVSPFMSALEAMVRFENGQPEDALELIRRCWGTMLKKGAKTFWEFAPNNETDRWDTPSHAWSGGCTYLLSAYVMGIRPAEADYKTLLLEPQPCDLESFRGVVPTSRGLVAASCRCAVERGKKEYHFMLAVPESIEVRCKLPENSTIEILKY